MHTLGSTEYEWDPAKAAANLRNHKVDFADAALALEDPLACTVHDPDSSGEQRYVMGADPTGRLLVAIFTRRRKRIRIISSRRASPAERRHYEED